MNFRKPCLLTDSTAITWDFYGLIRHCFTLQKDPEILPFFFFLNRNTQLGSFEKNITFAVQFHKIKLLIVTLTYCAIK